jgi:hypothetical protein
MYGAYCCMQFQQFLSFLLFEIQKCVLHVLVHNVPDSSFSEPEDVCIQNA